MAVKNKKEKTINDLTVFMETGFKRTDEKLEASISNLALMIGKGFEHVDHRMDSLDHRMDSLEKGQEEIIKSNTKDHEDMALRLDNVAYRFELVELKKRVEVLEQKAKVRA